MTLDRCKGERITIEGRHISMTAVNETAGSQRRRFGSANGARAESLRRLGVGVVLLMLTAAAATKGAAIFSNARQRTHSWDFSIYYASALMMRQNQNPYATDLRAVGDALGLETGDIQRAADTPTFLLCFEPLTLLPVTTAYWIWAAGGEDLDSRAFAFWMVTMLLLAPTAWTHYLVRLYLPLCRLAVAAYHGQASRRAIWFGVGSYTLITVIPWVLGKFGAHLPAAIVAGPVTFALPSVALAYLAFYWFAADKLSPAYPS